MRHEPFSTIADRSKHSSNFFVSWGLCVFLFLIGLFVGLFVGNNKGEIGLLNAELEVRKQTSQDLTAEKDRVTNELRSCRSQNSNLREQLRTCQHPN